MFGVLLDNPFGCGYTAKRLGSSRLCSAGQVVFIPLACFASHRRVASDNVGETITEAVAVSF